MTDRENDFQNHSGQSAAQDSQGRQVQQELERQLRELGDTMSDAFRNGFEGRGMEIGDRAYDVGKAAVHAANYGIGEAAKALRQERDRYAAGAGEAGFSGWVRQFFAKPEPTPVEAIRSSAKKRRSAGCTLLAVGIAFGVIFGMGALGAFAGAQLFFGTWLYSLTGAAGLLLAAAAAAFGWMAAAGASRFSASKRLELLADAAEEMDPRKGLPVEMLADLTHLPKKKALKTLRSSIRKGWLQAWLDEDTETLYLTAEDYRAARQARQEAAAQAAQPEPETADTETVPVYLAKARAFAQVLEREIPLMEDPRAVEELDHMQKTTTAICTWLEGHPESLPKARRFAEYYIPTTLKLLHTYNDVQGQQGDNAEAIRRDIAGILHTLNQAYDNLYDKLLSDMALDISSEIAALQGMLANDGLAGEEMR